MNTRQIMILVHFHDASIEGKIKADDRLQILNKSGNAFDRNQNKTQMLFFFFFSPMHFCLREIADIFLLLITLVIKLRGNKT